MPWTGSPGSTAGCSRWLALAVVEFATPLSEGDMKAFMKTHGGCAERVAYERRPGAWAGLLREHDDANLRAFDLDSP